MMDNNTCNLSIAEIAEIVRSVEENNENRFNPKNTEVCWWTTSVCEHHFSTIVTVAAPLRYFQVVVISNIVGEIVELQISKISLMDYCKILHTVEPVSLTVFISPTL
jgi:hypothetical protein